MWMSDGRLRLRSFLLGWSGSGSVIQDLSGSLCIKGTGESTLVMDSPVTECFCFVFGFWFLVLFLFFCLFFFFGADALRPCLRGMVRFG